ncbi:MAG: hypothetical protein A2741_00395 [Candidatus Zambryskibacteria bacterium RIFCSPHIGHO2_01_FULL_43_27]|nr:MAG: hypothetical protein A2741_00395 [Candidatus Zambryskibacteria bacterium RIFCSPHIGHO2_01_FULL_43_27]OHA99535.1 MAG: hypothetical protein A3E93_02225 [Candidatus Zambryskibacteria bacterium RIFCSPHIGHO2_12_FULL_43_12b]
MKSHEGISFMRFDLMYHRHLLSQVVDCYRNVFAEFPWDEWKKCEVCGTKWGISSLEVLSGANYMHCGQEVKDYHSIQRVLEQIQDEVRAETSSWIAMTEYGQVVGFAWAFPITLDALVAKLGRPDLPATISAGWDHQNRIAYLSEIGVLKEFQRRGIATRLAQRRLEEQRDQDLRVGIVRVKRTPPSVTYTWYSKRGFQLVSEYGDLEDRVILARGLQGLSFERD